MNPLQEYPHLFANTKFKALVDERDVYPILGVIANTSLYLEDAMLEDTYCVRIKRCQLIARPIEDMSAKELEMVSGLNAEDLIEWEKAEEEREQLKRWVNSRGTSLSFRHARQLLEIGVYPFDQSHFGDTVIDTRTLKTNEV